MRIHHFAAIAAAVAVSSAAVTSAGVLLDQPGGVEYTYSYGGAGVGTAEGDDTTIFFNSSAGFGFGGGAGQDDTTPDPLLDPTVDGQGVFSLSFDIDTTGAVDTPGAFGINAELQLKDNGQRGEDFDNVVVFQEVFAYDPAGGPQSFAINFTESDLIKGSYATIAEMINDGSFRSVNLNINYDNIEGLNIVDYFGNDSENSISQTNFLVVQSEAPIPEPASLALLGLGGLGLLRRRK